MAITPLCAKFDWLSLPSTEKGTVRRLIPTRTARRVYHQDSPAIFASALRPWHPEISQTNIRRARARPVKRARDVALLRVSRFRLAPTNPIKRPVEFADIPKVTNSDKPSSSEDEGKLHRIFQDPSFLKALARHHFKKAMRLRRHPRLLKLKEHLPYPFCKPVAKTNHKVPRRSTPFNEDTDLDPFEIFPEWQEPFSPLKEDSRRYKEEAKAALEAREARRFARRGSMSAAEVKDMIHIICGLGKYASPERRATTPGSFRGEVGSPMDID